jgi:hypothetical protein
MFTPSDSSSGMYFNLLEKTFQRLKTAAADRQMAAMIHEKFETSLKSGDIVLTSSEKKRLFNQVYRMLLEDMLSELNKDQNQ